MAAVFLLLASSRDTGSGWGAVAQHLSEALAAEGRVILLTGDEAEPEARRLTSQQRGRGRLLRLWRDAARVRRVLASEGLDPARVTLLAVDETVLPLAAFLNMRHGLRFGLVYHGTYAVDPGTGFDRRAMALAERRATAIFAVSRFTRDAVLETRPALAAKIHVANPGVPRGDITPLPRADRAPVVLSVAAVKPRKGADRLVEALGLIPAARRPRLEILGLTKPRSTFQRKVMDRIAALGLEDHVTFRGFVSAAERDQAYARAMLFALPSQQSRTGFEGFGLVHLEANQFGTPTIGCLNCGNEDAITDGETGFLVDPEDTAALADRIDRLCSDPGLWQRLSEAGHARVQAQTYAPMAEVVRRTLS